MCIPHLMHYNMIWLCLKSVVKVSPKLFYNLEIQIAYKVQYIFINNNNMKMTYGCLITWYAHSIIRISPL